jgi:hypothetical protein
MTPIARTMYAFFGMYLVHVFASNIYGFDDREIFEWKEAPHPDVDPKTGRRPIVAHADWLALSAPFKALSKAPNGPLMPLLRGEVTLDEFMSTKPPSRKEGP